MRLLIDTNIFLEVILDQDRASEASSFLKSATRDHESFMSDFSLHSIGVFLVRRRQVKAFRDFLSDVIFGLGINVKRLDETDMSSVCDVAERFRLDFDDAYQYVAAQRFDLTIVSYDSDFDRTDRGRTAPSQVPAGT
ncbi:MAG: type II toxin-antitoxin system VapC family toxin [Candidatus Coatesbacteria bacterium]|nr:type II toxin-antitoxin system VapC family toxin [Candidatus Coatesbacteria bacterium]